MGCQASRRRAALNGEVTRLIGKMPKDAIKAMFVAQKPSSTIPGRQVGPKEQKLPSGVAVRYLYQPGELEGGRIRVTDRLWSLQVYRLGRSVTKPDEHVLYYLLYGPPRGFVRKEHFVMPPRIRMPPGGSCLGHSVKDLNLQGLHVRAHRQCVHPIFCDPALGVEG